MPYIEIDMTAAEYLQSLIAGVEMGSEIPVQLSELKLLLALLESEK
jgi:hypothetical protein